MERPVYIITCAFDSITKATREHVEKVLGAEVAWLEFNPLRSSGMSPRVDRLMVKTPGKKTKQSAKQKGNQPS